MPPSSFEDAKDYVLRTLQESNALSRLQAEMRALVSQAALRDQPILKKGPRPSDSPDALLLSELIFEWLSFYGFVHTSSVLTTESNIKDQPSRAALVETLSKRQDFSDCSSEPLLLTLFSQCKHINSSHPSFTSPTKLTSPPNVSPQSDRVVSPPLSHSLPHSPFNSYNSDKSIDNASPLLEDTLPIPNMKGESSDEGVSSPMLPSPLPPSPLPFTKELTASSTNYPSSDEEMGEGIVMEQVQGVTEAEEVSEDSEIFDDDVLNSSLEDQKSEDQSFKPSTIVPGSSTFVTAKDLVISSSESEPPLDEESEDREEEKIITSSPKINSLMLLQSASEKSKIGGQKLGPINVPTVSLSSASKLPSKLPALKLSAPVKKPEDDLDLKFSDYSDLSDDDFKTSSLANLDEEIKNIESSMHLKASTVSSFQSSNLSLSLDSDPSKLIDEDIMAEFDSDLSDFESN
ncbi:hypothetical protein RCL1_004077 [Eukaryota sp. TZLM3-RCL]